MTTQTERNVSVSEPASEPLTLKEVKKHLEIADSDGTHDDQLAGLIISARQSWERDTGRVTTSRTIVETFSQDAFNGDAIQLVYRPVSSITTVKYYDTANSQQTLSNTVYNLDDSNRLVRLQVDQEWPATQDRWDCVEVTYVAGYTDVPELDKSAMKLRIHLDWADDSPAALGHFSRAYTALVSNNMRPNYP
jgi:uncharacterized phiE125 gp8 family phage protein